MTTKPKRARSDWRSCPRDHDDGSGMSFITYLCGPYTRGYDWVPDRPPSGVAVIHYAAGAVESTPPGHVIAKGNGKPRMRRFFLSWLSGKEPGIPGVKHAQVQRAVERARTRDPLRFEALEFRQMPSGPDKPSSVAWCASRKPNPITASTLTRWFNKAVELVVEELVADLNGMR